MKLILFLLGNYVEGQKTVSDTGPDQTHFVIKRGPYEVSVVEWTFKTGYENYSYHVKVGSEYILYSKFSVEKPEEAVELIETALRLKIKIS
jgi:hypothetical protein